MLTIAAESIVVQLVACPTVTKETADGVTAHLFTASIAYVTLIDIYIIQMHQHVQTDVPIYIVIVSTTFTAEAISSEACIAYAVVAAKCVTACSIVMTQVQP